MSGFKRSRQKLTPAVLVTVAASCAPAPPAGAPATIPELAGRTAGQSQNCVPIDPTATLGIVNERIAIYGSGRTLWVNHLRTHCRGADRMEILVTEPTGAQYCAGDPVRVLNPLTRTPGPLCVLGDFVPYTR